MVHPNRCCFCDQIEPHVPIDDRCSRPEPARAHLDVSAAVARIRDEFDTVAKIAGDRNFRPDIDSAMLNVNPLVDEIHALQTALYVAVLSDRPDVRVYYTRHTNGARAKIFICGSFVHTAIVPSPDWLKFVGAITRLPVRFYDETDPGNIRFISDPSLVRV